MKVMLSTKAIMQAYAGAAVLSAQGYKLQQYIAGNWFLVLTPAGSRYRVRPFGEGRIQASCNCPQFEAEGICKHTVWAAEQLNAKREQIQEDFLMDLAMADGYGDFHQTSCLCN